MQDIAHRHGSGTSDIFINNPNVLVVSLHRYDRSNFFPYSGGVDEKGVGAAAGTNVNIPWLPASEGVWVKRRSPWAGARGGGEQERNRWGRVSVCVCLCVCVWVVWV